jgi:hypothetical protein
MKLVRTQVYLEAGQHRRLKREAQARDVSLAQLLRDIVSIHISGNKASPRFTKEDFLSITALGESGTPDGAKAHDHYLGEALADGHPR